MSETTSLPRRRTREAPEVRRARILDEAIGLIGERGYYGFTVQELAARCGLTNPGLLHYYPSKHHVLLAVLAEMEARESEVFEPIVQMALSELGGASAKSGVLRVLHAMVFRATAKREMIRFLGELQSESLDPAHPAHDWWLVREKQTLGLFEMLLRPFVASPEATARQVLAMMDGLCMQWLRAPCGQDINAEWQAALERLLPELHGE